MKDKQNRRRIGYWIGTILLWTAVLVMNYILLIRAGVIAPLGQKEDLRTTAGSEEPAATDPVQPDGSEMQTVTVVFDDEGEKTEVTVKRGEPVDLIEAAGKEGYTFCGWEDEEGYVVRDEKPLPMADVILRALYVPTLGTDEHKAYLPMDASWRCRPDEPLTRAEAITRLYDMTPLLSDSAEAEEDLGAMMGRLRTIGVEVDVEADPNEAITRGEFLNLLKAYGPDVTDLAELDAGEPGEDMTRLDTAKLMNMILGRKADPAFLEKARTIIRDLPENDEDSLNLLEACLDHGHAYEDGSEKWTEVTLPELPIPGFTTGDLELDAWLKQIIDDRTSENNTLKENLRLLYRYVRDSFRYRKGEIHTDTESDWVAQEARKMMDEGGGNCFTYSSTLCELYRALGLDARVYAGAIAAEAQPHAWVEATIDGTTYIFDVEMEWTRLRFHQPYIDFFMRTYYDLKGWNYQRDFYM